MNICQNMVREERTRELRDMCWIVGPLRTGAAHFLNTYTRSHVQAVGPL